MIIAGPVFRAIFEERAFLLPRNNYLKSEFKKVRITEQ